MEIRDVGQPPLRLGHWVLGDLRVLCVALGRGGHGRGGRGRGRAHAHVHGGDDVGVEKIDVRRVLVQRC